MQNKKSAVRLLSLMISMIILSVFVPVLSVNAEEDYYNYIDNYDTGYYAYVDDEADLLTNEQEMALVEQMYGITEYGYVFLKTIDSNYTSADSYAEEFLHGCIGRHVSGTVFLIDLDNRMLYIFSDGAIYKTVTKGKANTITDNVYKFASAGDYYSCASEVFSEELTILEGGRIAQPMKYASNLLLAILCALIINYIVVYSTSSIGDASTDSIVKAAKVKLNVGTSNAILVSTSRRYIPPSDSGSSGGGGGGGGGSSGGGGGHSF